MIDTALDLLDLDGPKSDLDDAGQIYYDDDDLDDGAADSGSKFLGFLGRSDGVLLGLLLAVAFPIGLNRSLGGLKFVTPFSIGSMVRGKANVSSFFFSFPLACLTMFFSFVVSYFE